jgi:hypothetical protein
LKRNNLALNGQRDSHEHAVEKEPSLLGSTARARHSNINRPALNESRCNNTTMLCCGEQRCVCVCPGCGKDSITGVRCEPCGIAHDLTVQRERRESVKQALWLEMQLGALS